MAKGLVAGLMLSLAKEARHCCVEAITDLLLVMCGFTGSPTSSPKVRSTGAQLIAKKSAHAARGKLGTTNACRLSH